MTAAELIGILQTHSPDALVLGPDGNAFKDTVAVSFGEGLSRVTLITFGAPMKKSARKTRRRSAPERDSEELRLLGEARKTIQGLVDHGIGSTEDVAKIDELLKPLTHAQHAAINAAAPTKRGRVLSSLLEEAQELVGSTDLTLDDLRQIAETGAEAALAAIAKSLPPKQRRRFASVRRLLGEQAASAELLFWKTNIDSLAGTPLQALLDGRYAAVRTAARSYERRPTP